MPQKTFRSTIESIKTQPIISCHNISKTYGSDDNAVTVLKHISLDVHVGEFVAVVGPSGSGKSTLMHILGALDTPTDGSYQLNGKLVSSLRDDELANIRNKNIGFVFQSFNLLPRATAIRNVRLPLIYNDDFPNKDRDAQVTKSLQAAGFDLNKVENKSNQLSGGQMQRVAIARALVNNPSIILADEPTGNLDQATGRIVMDTFQRLHKEGRTIVVITHDVNVAQYASRIIQIEDGLIMSDRANQNLKMVSTTMEDYK